MVLGSQFDVEILGTLGRNKVKDDFAILNLKLVPSAEFHRWKMVR